MKYPVLLSSDAEQDIEDIHHFIRASESVARADHVIGRIEAAILALDELPERGNVPKELVAAGVDEFREIHFKPYRIIYRLNQGAVVVYCIADGRRDMQSFLEGRLLR